MTEREERKERKRKNRKQNADQTQWCILPGPSGPGRAPDRYGRRTSIGALPVPACPEVQRCTSPPGHSAGFMPKAARERVANPRAGTALAPQPGMHPGRVR